MTIIYLILAAITLGILIFIHELGHYFAARWMGMKVEIFSIGFGRPLLKWKFQGVDWQLGWLPFGGYVKIMGMEIGKNEKEKGIEPYEIPGGFFAHSPLKRIVVALAGPVSNLLLALLLFIGLWLIGGRAKPFSEYSHVVGWIDPASELYALGVRPGDKILEYNGKPFISAKDHLYASMLGGKEVNIKGVHVNYITKEERPFDYKIESYPSSNLIEGIKTTGILASARYLVYDRFLNGEANPLPSGSSLERSGIAYGDEFVWADGERLFSLEQLKYLLNSSRTLLTIQRGDQTFLTRQPRVSVGDLMLPSEIRAELSDWQYEAGIEGSWRSLFILPYHISAHGNIEYRLRFVDEDAYRAAFPLYPYSKELEQALQPGDKIIAVDGILVNDGYHLLQLLQEKRIRMIVKRNVSLDEKQSWKKEDSFFEDTMAANAIEELEAQIGTGKELPVKGDYYLLPPITPKRMDQMTLTKQEKDALAVKIANRKKEIEAISDSKKRDRLLENLKMSQQEYLLGIPLQDRYVNYNPSPLTLFGEVFAETWLTLKALVFGYLNPKWLSGPVGIVQVIQHGWKLGVREALFWIGAISLNLGFLNLLPIPVLDGGYICLSLWELLTRRRLKSKTMERIIIPFVVLLVGLLIFLTFQDITRLF